MWDEAKRQRFQELRQREPTAVLTEAEQAELASLIEELEAACLEPATQRLRHDRESIELQNRRLESLARRKEDLAERLLHFLADAEAERKDIDRELTAVLGTRESGMSDAPPR